MSAGNARAATVYFVVIVVGFVALSAAALARMTPGLILIPVELHFGWPRAAMSLAMAVNLITFGLVGPVAGAAVVRFGVKRVMSLGLFLIAAGAGLSRLMSAEWHYVALWGVMTGAGTGMVGPVMAASLTNTWFAERQGLVTGIFSTSNAAAALALLPLLASKVEAGTWRPATTIVCIIAAAVLAFTVLCLPESPRKLGVQRYGERSSQALVTSPATMTESVAALKAAVRSPVLWLLAGSFFVCGLTTNGLIGSHLVAFCSDNNISAVAAAGLLSMMGVFDLIGTTISGWLTDKINPWLILIFLYFLRALCLLILPFTDPNIQNLGIFLVVYGLNYVATVPPTVRLANAHFGESNGPILFGWIMVPISWVQLLRHWAAASCVQPMGLTHRHS